MQIFVRHLALSLLVLLLHSPATWAVTSSAVGGASQIDIDLLSSHALILDSVPDLSESAAESRLAELLRGDVRPATCSKEGCWFAVPLQSSADTDLDLAVSIFDSPAQLWVLPGDGRAAFALRPSGTFSVDLSQRGDRYPHFVLHRGENVTLLIRATKGGDVFPADISQWVRIQPYASFLQDENRRENLGFLIVGGLIALGLYNFFLARAAQEPSYYFYCMYLFFMTFSTIGASMDNVMGAVWFPEHPIIGRVLQHLTDCFMWLSMIAFARAFLETKRRIPRFDRLWIVPVALGLGGLLFGFLGLPQWQVVAYLGYATPAPLGIVAAFLTLRQGFRPARYFFAAQLVLGVGVVLQAGQDQGLIDFNLADGSLLALLDGRILWVTSFVETVIFSLALADRLRSLKHTVAEQTIVHLRDRENLIRAQNDKLELEVAERTSELQQEKYKSDQLLLSVLPLEIAEELKKQGYSRPRRYDDVSILFTDFRNFTTTVSSLPADRLVDELNDIFQDFDEILLKHGLEKIKTIGDSYMVASGLPEIIPDHAQRCVAAALEMLAFIATRNEKSAIKWGMRAGIHSGAVVAGIVGKTKFAFDVFGDTVNIASRMESNSEAGRLNVSAYTYDLIKGVYRGSYRGKVEVKGKGEIDMYFVESKALADKAAS